MSQHTPGPWEVDRSDEDVLVITQDQKIAVAALWLENVETLDKVMPDARLIAAAPEMLELLERYVKRGDDLSAEYREARALLARLQPDTERKG